MSSGTKAALESGITSARSSPDWMEQGSETRTAAIATSDGGQDSTELKYRSPENLASAKLAKGIGLFSLALGTMEVVGAKQLAEAVGLDKNLTKYLPLLGVREIAHGISIMKGEKPTNALWARVVGDAIDLAFIGLAFTSEGTNKKKMAVAAAAVGGVTALDIMCAQKLMKPWREADGNPLAPTTSGQPSARSNGHKYANGREV